MLSVGIAGLVISLIALLLWGYPKYRIYALEMNGKALLKEAENERKILIEEAAAKFEAAKLLSDAEIERAKGVAEANKIIAEALSATSFL